MKFGKKWRRKDKQTNEESVSVLVFITDIPVSTFLFPGNDQIINTVVECKVKGMWQTESNSFSLCRSLFADK